jgi:hypothetical protein
MTATTLDLASAPVLQRAADHIVARGISRDAYVTPDDSKPSQEWPVDAMGAIAVACGLHPDVWENEDRDNGDITPANNAAALLADSLGLDPQPALDETLGAWSDKHTPAQVVTAMRNAAQEAEATP